LIDAPDQTFLRAAMFGSLSKGGSIQVREVLVGRDADSARETGIHVTAVKQTGSSGWVETVTFKGDVYPSVAEALMHWRVGK
jgi:hypothetical protein